MLAFLMLHFNWFSSELSAINSGFLGFPSCSLMSKRVEMFEEL